MGYDLHVTRGDGKRIDEGEWRSYVRNDPEFELTNAAEVPMQNAALRYESPGLASWRGHPGGQVVWFDFRDGCIVVKNPDEPTIERMLIVARAVGAHVEGDDGEIYDSPGGTVQLPRVSLAARLQGWLAQLRPTPKLDPIVVPFAVGQRVSDFHGHVGVVIAIDVVSNHGLGRIDVRFDDGREITFSAAAHGLDPVRERDSERQSNE